MVRFFNESRKLKYPRREVKKTYKLGHLVVGKYKVVGIVSSKKINKLEETDRQQPRPGNSETNQNCSEKRSKQFSCGKIEKWIYSGRESKTSAKKVSVIVKRNITYDLSF